MTTTREPPEMVPSAEERSREIFNIKTEYEQISRPTAIACGTVLAEDAYRDGLNAAQEKIQRQKEVIEGQGLSMRAMSDELRAARAEIERLTEERDNYRADYIRVHHEKCDLLYPETARSRPGPTEDDPLDLSKVFIGGTHLCHHGSMAKVCPTCKEIADAERRGERKGLERALKLADEMTNQRDLIRKIMALAGIEKFERTTRCVLCHKEPRPDDGGMLCLKCRALAQGATDE